ncbi:MAG: 30S ribosomal protein S6 [Spirochaetales bacterium]|nr:30S ribosomal protein S6 [Spirochaetales bacterium]
MRAYEAIFVFRPEDELFAKGKELVKTELDRVEAKIVKEDDMGSRELAYEVKKETRAHYYFYEAEIDPLKIDEMSKSIKLMEPVLKHLFIRKEQ